MRAKGTIIKLAISIDLPSGLTMDDVDFQCRFFVFSASQVIEKSQMVRINENNLRAKTPLSAARPTICVRD